MARQSKATAPDSTSAARVGFEAKLWQAADALRNNMDAAEYKHVVLGLIFLKYISDAFEEHHAKLEADRAQGADPEHVDEYRAANIFWVPKKARWEYLKSNARQATIGKLVDDAMDAIEKENQTLKGVLPKDFARPGLDKSRLGQLIDLVSNIGLGDKASRSKDVLGRVYEYFLTQFASAEGKNGGQFYTPNGVVQILVNMLSPFKGRVYDPCCGSGGMFVQSERFIEAHGGKIGQLSIYGQESNYTTWRLAKMNLAIRGIENKIEHDDTFHDDRFPDLRADYILANPHFNDSDWRGELLKDDKRWKYGVPPPGNANFAWVQHFIHHLAPSGVAGFILGNISLTSGTGGEDVIRKAIVDANLLECIVTLPDRLFYSTPIPAGIWILRKGRPSRSAAGKAGRDVLFIDASKLGVPVTRTHQELSDVDIDAVAQTYRRWLDSSGEYSDKEDFCRSVPIDEIVKNGYDLLPAAYVNAGHVELKQGARLRDLFENPERNIASRSLAQLMELSQSFDKAAERVRLEIGAKETRVTLKEYLLSDVLERSEERLGDSEEPDVLTCTERGGLILQKERFAKRVATDDASNYKIVRMGDIVYNPYLLWKGSIDQCWIVDRGITSPAYEILRVRPGFDRTVVGQLLISPEMIKRYNGISFGTVQRRRRAPVERFLELKVNLPTSKQSPELNDFLAAAQACQFASRNSERAIRQLIKSICARLR